MNTTSTKYLEISLEDNAVISDIKKALKMIRGIASVKIVTTNKKEEVINDTTKKAIEEVKAGKMFKASSVDDLFIKCLQ